MKELLEKIGKQALYNANGFGSFMVKVKVLDVKMSYGKVRYLITPMSGSGEIWVEQLNFKI